MESVKEASSSYEAGGLLKFAQNIRLMTWFKDCVSCCCGLAVVLAVSVTATVVSPQHHFMEN